jgi:CelD/BcsL family acetyltransferase involved in cellulose biosynthesis
VATREVRVADDAWCLGEAWDALVARCASPGYFLTRSFQSLWWATLGEGDLRVLVGEAGGRPCFIAPLYISTVPDLGRTVRLIGGSEVADYLDLIAAPGDLAAAWQATFNYLADARADWDAIELRGVPGASPSRALVAAAAAARGWTVEETLDDVCPVVTLPATWDEYLRGLRKKDRHELRRKTGRLEAAPAGERFEMIGPADDLAAALADFLRLHRLSGQEKEGFWTPALQQFFERLIAATHADGTLRLAFQSIGGQRAACVLSIRYGDRYYVYNSGYDPAYREYAVGVVTMGRVIRAAIAEGAAIFDLLQGDEPYKYDFGAVNTEVYRLVVRPAAP